MLVQVIVAPASLLQNQEDGEHLEWCEGKLHTLLLQWQVALGCWPLQEVTSGGRKQLVKLK